MPQCLAFLSMTAILPPGRSISAQFGDGSLDIHGVFERFGGVGPVERCVCEGQICEDAGDFADADGYSVEHSFGDIQTGETRFRILFEQHAGIAAFAAARIEQTAASDGREEAKEHLNVENTGIDGGREVLFVTRGLVEALDEFSMAKFIGLRVAPRLGFGAVLKGRGSLMLPVPLSVRQKDGEIHLAGVTGTIAFGIVHLRHVNRAGSEFGIRDRHGGVFASVNGGHDTFANLTDGDDIDGHAHRRCWPPCGRRNRERRCADRR